MSGEEELYEYEDCNYDVFNGDYLSDNHGAPRTRRICRNRPRIAWDMTPSSPIRVEPVFVRRVPVGEKVRSLHPSR